jgi:predicted nucleic acid-binding protein
LIVISDASPLIALAAIGQLNLLPALFDTVVIPRGVLDEVMALGETAPGAREVLSASWVEVKDLPPSGLVEGLPRQLGRGESEAITLAVRLAAEGTLLLIDEVRGRQVALRMQVRIVGVLGIILQAKAAGLLLSVADALDALAERTTFRVGQRLRSDVLSLAGEA